MLSLDQFETKLRHATTSFATRVVTAAAGLRLGHSVGGRAQAGKREAVRGRVRQQCRRQVVAALTQLQLGGSACAGAWVGTRVHAQRLSEGQSRGHVFAACVHGTRVGSAATPATPAPAVARGARWPAGGGWRPVWRAQSVARTPPGAPRMPGGCAPSPRAAWPPPRAGPRSASAAHGARPLLGPRRAGRRHRCMARRRRARRG